MASAGVVLAISRQAKAWRKQERDDPATAAARRRLRRRAIFWRLALLFLAGGASYLYLRWRKRKADIAGTIFGVVGRGLDKLLTDRGKGLFFNMLMRQFLRNFMK